MPATYTIYTTLAHLTPPKFLAGHMRLRAILNREPPFPSDFKGAPIIAQFSSLGSIEEKWCAVLMHVPAGLMDAWVLSKRGCRWLGADGQCLGLSCHSKHHQLAA